MKELQELRNEILTLRNYGVINKEEEKSLLTKLNSVKEELRLSRFSKQSELLVCDICEEPLEKVLGKVCENTMCDRHR